MRNGYLAKLGKSQTMCCWLRELAWFNHRAILTQDQRPASVHLLQSIMNSDIEGAGLSETVICLCARTSLSVSQSYLPLLDASIKGKE